MQLNLGFLKDLRPLTDPRLDPNVWAVLEDEQRIAVEMATRKGTPTAT